MKKEPIYLLLADDDADDCVLFQDALDEIKEAGLHIQLNMVQNGEQLMQFLQQRGARLPDTLFLDLNMPRKNGFQCLAELKRDEVLKKIPVVVISTSYQKEVTNLLYNYGAFHYIQKPNDYAQFKKIIHHVLELIADNKLVQPSKENFVLFPTTFR